MKRIFSLLIALLLTASLLPAATAENLDDYAKGSFTQGYDVYSGPGTHYHRVNGNTRYGGKGGCRIYGYTSDWLLIGYGSSNNTYHIGYIPKDALNYVQNLQGEVKELQFTNTAATVTEDQTGLNDDPIINYSRFDTLNAGDQVTVLGTMSSWSYVEVTLKNGKPARGFVTSRKLDDGTTPVITATPKPQPTNAPVTARPQPTQAPNIDGKESLLSKLSHNCPNTGIMLPSAFSPYQTNYLLTVADWVSRVTFTPTSYDPNATITVNGQYVRSGEKSQIIQMSNDPQAVTIQVRASNGVESTYTVFLQRRPSTARTRVSVGYINDIYQKNNDYYISADLVTVNYFSDDYNTGNRSTIYNDSSYLYKYVVDPNCSFHYGSVNNAYRAADISEFMNGWKQNRNALFTIVYIADEIVAVMPYSETR